VNVVWVTHDLEQLRRVADHVLVLIGGRIAHSGPAATLESDSAPDVRRFLAAVAVDDEVGER
jgi:ABC-type transporter Mla maintaining outer membrane lipid asymmetry ATPase subunit MlaF